MSLLLTNSFLLPLAALILVPLLLHLFARARPPAYVFSSVEFLRRVMRKTVRIKKPQSILVLILRTILFAAVIALFLKPVWFGNYRLPGPGARRAVVILLDATASMGAVEGTQTRFAAACAKAAEILAELAGGDTANIIWLGTPNHAEFPQLSGNVAYLKKTLRDARVTMEAADIPGALAMAADQLRSQEGVREIFVLSDFQASAWDGSLRGAPEKARIYAIKIGEKTLPNQALTRLTLQPPNPLPGQEVKIYCEVHNFSAEHALGTIYLRAGELHDTREVRLAPWQQAAVVFTAKFSRPGEHAISAALSEDSFPYDNERWAVAEVPEALTVGLYEGEPQTAAYWRRAVEALGWARLEGITTARLQQELACDVLLLAGWGVERGTQERIREYLGRGGTVFWFPHEQTPWREAAAVIGGRSADGWMWQKATEPWGLRVEKPDFGGLRVFEGGLYGDPARGRFTGRFQFTPSALKSGEVIFSFTDGVPALVRCEGPGQLFLWNLPLQREFSDWATQPEFVPLLGELMFNYRKFPDSESPRAFLTGQPLVLPVAGQVLASDVRLERSGQMLTLTGMAGNNGMVLSSVESRLPGLYHWSYRGESMGCQVVNFPEVESDLRPESGTAAANAPVTQLQASQSMARLQDGTPLWPLLLALAVGMALVEGLVLTRVDKT